MAEPLIFSPAQHQYLLPSFASLHRRCIEVDHMLANFLPPLDSDRILGYWQAQAASVSQSGRIIFFTLAHNSIGDEEVSSVVMLQGSNSEAEPFRAEVLKLLVSPDHRRKGIAKALMRKLEIVAREKGSTILLLDTEVGSEAEKVYPRLGYTLLGVIPEFGISPKDRRLVGGAFFYKDLNKSSPL